MDLLQHARFVQSLMSAEEWAAFCSAPEQGRRDLALTVLERYFAGIRSAALSPEWSLAANCIVLESFTQKMRRVEDIAA